LIVAAAMTDRRRGGFPGKVRDYFEAMMGRIGFQPLPVA